MARRKTLTDNMVRKLKPGPKRLTLPDPELRGHYVRVTPKGAKSYVAVARDPGGKQVWATTGGADVLTIDEAREKARGAIQRIKAGLAPFEAPPARPDSFRDVAENYMQRHVRGNKLRSEDEIQRLLDTDIYPRWSDLTFAEIRRSDVTRLLDGVQDRSGPQHADHVLAVVRGIMNWYMSRSDDYISPIARGMRRTDPRKRARDRFLDDDEIRLIWKTAESCGSYGAIIRLLLLTAQRREKVAAMQWADIRIDGAWAISTEEREKGNAGILTLPQAAVDIIRNQPRRDGSPWIFPARSGDGHISGWSPLKRNFDGKLTIDGEALADWRLHDLRRTSRSLLARAGVLPHVAERVLGHVLQGVEGIYDRHHYEKEKADALKKLAGLIALILDPPAGNVTELHAEATT